MDVNVNLKLIYENPNGWKKDKITLLVCLGILCALLVGGIIWVTVLMTKYETSLGNKETEVKNLNDENQQLVADMRNLENLTGQLSRERNDLNLTLGLILSHVNFPVNDVCPNKKCQPCLTGWILFQGKCYLFSKLTSGMSWTQSRQYCEGQSADLVVINNLEEQKFVSSQSEYYGEPWHGYWLGLLHINNRWIWIDGHEDTLGYWIFQPDISSGPFALLVPKPGGLVFPVTHTWYTSYDGYQNRFICEREALISCN